MGASGKHLIATGTANLTNLDPQKTDGDRDFALIWPETIPVPVFIWKLVYDVQNKNGTVFIGLNTPFKRSDPTKHVGEKIPCPGSFGRQLPGLETVYCCTKESFEKAYGPLDPVIFEDL